MGDIQKFSKGERKLTPVIPSKKDNSTVLDNRTFETILREEHGFQVGDLFYDLEHKQFLKIAEIRTECEHLNKVYKIPFEGNIIYLQSYEEIGYGDGITKTEWHGYGDISLEELKRRVWDRYARISSMEELDNKVEILGKNFNNLEEAFGQMLSNQTPGSTELMRLDKSNLEGMKLIYESKSNDIKVLEAVMQRKMDELAVIRDRFTSVVHKIKKVIDNIELYLGIHEDVVQIQSGNRASVDTKLTLHQRILYMDEEVGIATGGGLDWRDIDDFDEWLLQDTHLDLIIPEKKAVVILKVRRKDKYYSDNPFDNSALNENNRRTYFLIRNGDCIYRIYANIHIYPRLFPKRKELQDIQNSDSYWVKRSLDDTLEQYKQHLLVIQGILDRSDILWPLPRKINLLNSQDLDDMVNMIYDDDDNLLDDGRERYREWRGRLNKYNKVGSRIVYSGVEYNDIAGRLVHKHGPRPWADIYNINRELSKSYHGFNFSFKYNPEDTVWTYNPWGGHSTHKRKRSLTFYIHKDDYCILNYDNIMIEDLDRFIYDRREREHYMDMIPLLKKLKELKIKEMEEEKQFIKLMLRTFGITEEHNHFEYYSKIVADGITWWKFKVIEKRALMKDDKKAFRMIRSFIENSIYM